MKNTDLLVFQECPIKGYRQRTIDNASADITFVFAIKFNTSGEKLTHEEVIRQNKLYFSIDLLNTLLSKRKYIDTIVEEINALQKDQVTINIAGNSISRFKNTHFTQEKLDEYITVFLTKLITSDKAKFEVSLIRSGGQSGADEAGGKAGLKLGIPTLIYAPKGWMYRDEYNTDIYDEILFKKRFEV